MSTPKEIGIPLYRHEVLGILDGRQTQIRRIVKRVKGVGFVTEFQRSDTPGYDWTMRDKHMRWNDLKHAELLKRCPYGEPGSILFGKEPWRAYIGETMKTRFGVINVHSNDPKPGDRIRYKADSDLSKDFTTYKSSIHMPRWASRILLEVANVRVECLQDISEEDAIAEGIDYLCAGLFRDYLQGNDIGIDSAIGSYQSLWESINGKGSWDLNPLVWVVEFKSSQIARVAA